MQYRKAITDKANEADAGIAVLEEAATEAYMAVVGVADMIKPGDSAYLKTLAGDVANAIQACHRVRGEMARLGLIDPHSLGPVAAEDMAALDPEVDGE